MVLLNLLLRLSGTQKTKQANENNSNHYILYICNLSIAGVNRNRTCNNTIYNAIMILRQGDITGFDDAEVIEVTEQENTQTDEEGDANGSNGH